MHSKPCFLLAHSLVYRRTICKLKIPHMGPDVVQQLRAHIAPALDPGSVPSTDTVAHNHCDSSSWES